jgi:hypothetical protein
MAMNKEQVQEILSKRGLKQVEPEVAADGQPGRAYRRPDSDASAPDIVVLQRQYGATSAPPPNRNANNAIAEVESDGNEGGDTIVLATPDSGSGGRLSKPKAYVLSAEDGEIIAEQG